CGLVSCTSEMARVREVVREPVAGEIRLQWWSDVLGGAGRGEVAAHPVAAALLETIASYSLAPERSNRALSSPGRAGRGGVAADPVAAARLETMARYQLPPERLTALIEARRFDLYDEPMPTLADLEAYWKGGSAG